MEKVQIENFHYDNLPIMTLIVIYCIMQFVFYSLVPVVLYETGATSLQLTLLTADFFNILFGILIHQYKVYNILYSQQRIKQGFVKRAIAKFFIIFFFTVSHFVLFIVRANDDRYLRLRDKTYTDDVAGFASWKPTN